MKVRGGRRRAARAVSVASQELAAATGWSPTALREVQERMNRTLEQLEWARLGVVIFDEGWRS